MCFHVDDCRLLHKLPEVMNDRFEILEYVWRWLGFNKGSQRKGPHVLEHVSGPLKQWAVYHHSERLCD